MAPDLRVLFSFWGFNEITCGGVKKLAWCILYTFPNLAAEFET